MGIARVVEDFDAGRIRRLDWRWWWLLSWVAIAVWLIVTKWNAIHWFALIDTDDNLRMAQVRALTEGQGWYDLRQYKLGGPEGANIHWSRLVDLPIAGLLLAAKPFVGEAMAERIAAAGAPLMALGVGLYALMLTTRRLIDPWAWPIAVATLLFAQTTLGMWSPLRIDHHGWQLALLMVAVAGSADSSRVRGGITTGLATAASLAVGLELLPYLALCGMLTVLAWVWDRQEADRLRAYGVALGGGCALAYLLFASNDNRAYVCDVLSPVYLSTMVAAGAIAAILSMIPAESRGRRLLLAGGLGAVLACGFVLAWPDCLGRPERISPELEQMWFQYIREVKPMWSHGYKRYVAVMALAVIGTIGTLAALWTNRHNERTRAWLTLAVLSLAGTGLLFWQARAGPAAQLLAIPGATWLGFQLVRRALASGRATVRVLGSLAAVLLVTGAAISSAVQYFPDAATNEGRKKVSLANRRCPTLPALAAIDRIPPATILTFVDLSPRLINVTHHRAIAGPYHRNGEAILDVQRSFRAESPEVARSVMHRYGATYLLLCPGMSESTIYASQSRNGFYRQLVAGRVPAWLEPVPLPKGSPFLLWRMKDGEK